MFTSEESSVAWSFSHQFQASTDNGLRLPAVGSSSISTIRRFSIFWPLRLHRHSIIAMFGAATNGIAFFPFLPVV
jgi:hypothetical protein